MGSNAGMQICFNIFKSVDEIHHINTLKIKNYIIISIDAKYLLTNFSIHL